MGSDTESQGEQQKAPVQAPAPVPSASAAPASGGNKTGMMVAVVVVVIVVVAVLAYVFLLGGGSGDSLSGQWTVSGGEMVMYGVANNDTANATWQNMTIPASPTVIDFDDETTMPAGMVFKDLGDGEFEIEDFSMSGTDFGTIHGSYSVDGDTMTLTISASGSMVDEYSGDYLEIEFTQTMTFARA